MVVKSLHSTCHGLLLANAAVLRDVGFSPYSLIRDILFTMRATQLRIIEANSEHLHPETEEIWRFLCNEFIQIRISMEDGVMREPKSWRELYKKEESIAAEKLAGARVKLREKAAQFKADKRTIIAVDGVISQGNRKKANSSNYKPKSLMEKVRVKSKIVSRIYAPRRRPSTEFPLPSRITASLQPHPSSLPPVTLPSSISKKSKPTITIRTIKSVKLATTTTASPSVKSSMPPIILPVPIVRPALNLPARSTARKPSSLFMPKRSIKR